MHRVEQWLREVEAARRRPVETRVAELLDAVRQGAQRFAGESWDQANERHAEEFIARLREQFPQRVFEVARPAAHAQQEQVIRRVLSGRSGESADLPSDATPADSSPRQAPSGLGLLSSTCTWGPYLAIMLLRAFEKQSN